MIRELLQTPAACLLLCFAVLFAAVVVVLVVLVLMPIVAATIVDLLSLNGSSISGSLFACFHFHLLYMCELICMCVCVGVSFVCI